MSYLPGKRRRRARRRGRAALGDLASVVASVENAIGTSFDVASDPYFTETLCHIGQLKQIKAGTPYSACAETPPGMPGGVGLDKLQVPLRYYVYGRANPWVFPVTIAAVLALPFLFGYELGKGSR